MAGFGVKFVVLVFKQRFVTVDSSEQLGLNIPLRSIFKPFYSPHRINTNVTQKNDLLPSAASSEILEA